MYSINRFSVQFFKTDKRKKKIEIKELAVLGAKANSFFIDDKGRLRVRRIIDHFNVWSKTFEKNHSYEIIVNIAGIAKNTPPRKVRYRVIFNRYNPIVTLNTHVGIDKHLNTNLQYACEELIFTVKETEVLDT